MKMKTIILLLCFYALLFPVGCQADETIVVGSISCKEWIADRTAEPDHTKKNIDQNWLIGFLGGYAATSGVDFLKLITVESAYLWMDKYCTAYPQKKVNDGATVLVHELVKQAGK